MYKFFTCVFKFTYKAYFILAYERIRVWYHNFDLGGSDLSLYGNNELS